MNRFNLALVLALVSDFCAPALAQKVDTAVVASDTPAQGAEADSVIESFVVDGNGGHLLIPVTVNNKEYQFVLDTGATINMFDARLKAALKPTGRTSPLNKGTPVELYDGQEANVGSSGLSVGTWATCLDLAALGNALDCEIGGILGMSFLKDKVVQIDFDAGRLAILRRAGDIPGHRIQMVFRDGNASPLVEVELPFVGKERFLLDTGSAGFESGFLRQEVFDELIRTKFLEKGGRMLTYRPVDGEQQPRLGVLAWQSFSGLRHASQVYTEDLSKNSQSGLGIGYLARYKATFDFPARCLILQEGKWFHRHCPANQAGVDIELSNGVLTVLEVDEGGPAWVSGLRPRDRILAMNGKVPPNLFLDIGSRLYWDRDRPAGIRLTVSRGDESETREIRLMEKPLTELPTQAR